MTLNGYFYTKESDSEKKYVYKNDCKLVIFFSNQLIPLVSSLSKIDCGQQQPWEVEH